MILSRVLTGIVTAGVIVAGVVLWQLTGGRRARWIIAALAAYGVVAFAHATLNGIPLPAVLGGQGLFRAVPYVLQGAFVGGLILVPFGWVVAVVRAGIPRFREGSPRHNIYQVVALTTCVGLVLTSVPHGTSGSRFDAGASGSPSLAARTAELDRSLRAIEDGERDSPRDSWDPKYVIDRIGHDDAALFTWARTNTFWVPYRGLLRGPVGVLMDRLGNSLDRAVLLATLLRGAGYTVRLAHAQLAPEIAATVLARVIARPSAPDTAIGNDARSDAAVRDVAVQYGLDQRDIRRTLDASQSSMASVISDIAKRTAEQGPRLSAMVSRPGLPGADARERMDAALNALRDHWWVQRQNGAAWIDFDLQADAVIAGHALAAPEETVELTDAATSRAHEIVVRIVAERSRDGATAEGTIFEHLLRPADTIGEPIVLQFWPIDWPADFRPIGPNPRQAVRATALAQHHWEARLVIGSTVAKRAVFTDTGDVEDAHLTSNPFGGLAGAFSNTTGVSHGPAGQALTAVWVEYETRVPGEPIRTTRRSVFDLLGPAARHSTTIPSAVLSDDERLARSLSLMMRTEILPIVCRIAPEFLVHLLADSTMQNRTLLRSAARGELDDPSAALHALASPAAPPPSPLYALAIARFDWNASQDHVYIDRPGILSRHVLPVWRPGGIVVRDAADIVTNDIGVDLLAPDAFAVRLAQGVLDTNVERLAHGPGRLVGDISQAFATSTEWLRMQSPDEPPFRDLKLPDDARRRIADDLRAGYIVVAPKNAVLLDGDAFVGWWRIEPKTGQVLGIGDNGWGSSITERSFLSVFAEQMAKEFAFQYLLCLSFAEATAQIDVWWMTGSPAPLGQAASQSWTGCSLFSLISAGFFVTLPFLTTYLAVRAGMPGGITGGFTLWLRGMRGRLPILPREGPPLPPSEPPLLKSTPKPPCEGPEPIGPKAEPGPSDLEPPAATGKSAFPAEFAYGPSPDHPLSPQEYKKYLAYTQFRSAEAEQKFADVGQRYRAAQQTNAEALAAKEKAEEYYQATKAQNLDRTVQDDAYVKFNEADRQALRATKDVTDAQLVLDRASGELSKMRSREAFSHRMEAPNAQAWQAQQKYRDASNEFAEWLEAHPQGARCSDEFIEVLYEYSAEKEQYKNAMSDFYREELFGGDPPGNGGGPPGRGGPAVDPIGNEGPPLEKTQPAADPSQPALDKTQPAGDPSQPALDKTQPAQKQGPDPENPRSPRATTLPGVDHSRSPLATTMSGEIGVGNVFKRPN
jgi:hypothetical protein